MDTFTLPCVLRESTTIEQAIYAMKSSDRRAILVWRRFKEYWLYFNADIAQARAKRVELLRDLVCPDDPARHLKPLAEIQPLVRWVAGDAMPALGAQAKLRVERALDGNKKRYGVLVAPDPPPPVGSAPDDVQLALIASRTESDARMIMTAPKACVCSGPKAHLAQAPPKMQDQGCALCAGKYDCF